MTGLAILIGREILREEGKTCRTSRIEKHHQFQTRSSGIVMHRVPCLQMFKIRCLREMFLQCLPVISMPCHLMHQTTRIKYLTGAAAIGHQMLDLAIKELVKAIQKVRVIKVVVKDTRVVTLEAICQVVLVIKQDGLVIREAVLVDIKEVALHIKAVALVIREAIHLIKVASLAPRQETLVIREVIHLIKVASLAPHQAALVTKEVPATTSKVDLGIKGVLLIKEETCLEEINRQHPWIFCTKLI